jgi:hypothetical protein
MDIATMRARVREDLQDTDAANYRWTNDEVDGAIERVVREFSLEYPLMQTTDIATTDGSNELDISSLSKLIKVYSVEFPLGVEPPYYQRFERWEDKLYMEEKGNGGNARIRWYKQHTLDAASSTIPEQFEELIVLGATGYLAASAAVYTVDKATIAGRFATANFLKWGQTRLDRYQRQLKQISRKNRVIQKELYTD